jgi:tRNA G37 N-methylase TrmD
MCVCVERNEPSLLYQQKHEVVKYWRSRHDCMTTKEEQEETQLQHDLREFTNIRIKECVQLCDCVIV